MFYLFTSKPSIRHIDASPDEVLDMFRERITVGRFEDPILTESAYKNKKQIDVDVPGIFHGTIRGNQLRIQHLEWGIDRTSVMHVTLMPDAFGGTLVKVRFGALHEHIGWVVAISFLVIVLALIAGAIVLLKPNSYDAREFFNYSLLYLAGIPCMLLGYKIYGARDDGHLRQLLDKVCPETITSSNAETA